MVANGLTEKVTKDKVMRTVFSVLFFYAKISFCFWRNILCIWMQKDRLVVSEL